MMQLNLHCGSSLRNFNTLKISSRSTINVSSSCSTVAALTPLAILEQIKSPISCNPLCKTVSFKDLKSFISETFLLRFSKPNSNKTLKSKHLPHKCSPHLVLSAQLFLSGVFSFVVKECRRPVLLLLEGTLEHIRPLVAPCHNHEPLSMNSDNSRHHLRNFP